MGYLDEEIVALHSEIVELQRSPFARRQGDVMEQLSVSLLYLQYKNVLKNNCDMHELTLPLSFFFSEEKAIELYKQLKAKCKS